MLAKSVNNGHDWDIQLPYVLFVYQAAVQELTQVSMFQMLYGREPVLSHEQALNYFPNVMRGKAWKFARPLYYGPYVIESLTTTNAEV